MDGRLSSKEREELAHRIVNTEGYSEEIIAWLDRIRKQTPWFHESDFLLGLERIIRTRQIHDVLAGQKGDGPTAQL